MSKYAPFLEKNTMQNDELVKQWIRESGNKELTSGSWFKLFLYSNKNVAVFDGTHPLPNCCWFPTAHLSWQLPYANEFIIIYV